MKNFVVAFTLLMCSVVYSQEIVKTEKFTFESRLNHVTKSDSIRKILKEITSINIPNKKDTSTVFNKNSKWKLEYLHKSGWRENFPNQRYAINDVYVGKKNNLVLGNEIAEYISNFQQKIIFLKDFPNPIQIEPRGAQFNGKYTIIVLENDYINLQYIHSYPNGNQSSWYMVTNYYFKKVKN